ncbi:MAG: 50S ribosomal protein L24 [Minisyncoccales bacterium]
MRIRKGDIVLIIKGKDRGKKGKVLQVFPRENRIMVEGVNLRKKHQRPRRAGEKGQIIILPGRFSASNVKLICSKCGQATRVGYKIEGEKKFRICKKCHQET